jgi:hypothetical protein
MMRTENLLLFLDGFDCSGRQGMNLHIRPQRL